MDRELGRLLRGQRHDAEAGAGRDGLHEGRRAVVGKAHDVERERPELRRRHLHVDARARHEPERRRNARVHGEAFRDTERHPPRRRLPCASPRDGVRLREVTARVVALRDGPRRCRTAPDERKKRERARVHVRPKHDAERNDAPRDVKPTES
jgi:hypothetical protein